MKSYTKVDYDDGTLEEEKIFHDDHGRFHREGDEPAIWQRARDGSETLHWCIHGAWTRPAGGPIVVMRSNMGTVIHEIFGRGPQQQAERNDPRLARSVVGGS